MKKWLMKQLLKKVFTGISEHDTLQYEQLSERDKADYLLLAREVHRNTTFQAELQRLKFKQERKLVEKAETWDDFVWGKATLYVIDLILKRFEFLSLVTNQEEKEAGY